jgi:hypothetical protein
MQRAHTLPVGRQGLQGLGGRREAQRCGLTCQCWRDWQSASSEPRRLTLCRPSFPHVVLELLKDGVSHISCGRRLSAGHVAPVNAHAQAATAGSVGARLRCVRLLAVAHLSIAAACGMHLCANTAGAPCTRFAQTAVRSALPTLRALFTSQAQCLPPHAPWAHQNSLGTVHCVPKDHPHRSARVARPCPTASPKEDSLRNDSHATPRTSPPAPHCLTLSAQSSRSCSTSRPRRARESENRVLELTPK